MTIQNQKTKIEEMSFSLERRSGVAVWRQIADQLRNSINADIFQVDERLPAEMELAKRFDVNRHTVRAALTALANEGIVESRQGQGTFVKRSSRIVYPIGKRTRFSDGLSGQAQSISGTLLAHSIEGADIAIASALKVAADTSMVRLETLSHADGIPLSRATSWFLHDRFGEIAAHYGKTGSITQSLKRLGIDDYVRLLTQVDAHHATSEDARDLRLSPGAIVLVTQSVNGDMDGNPIQFSRTRFAADRVSLMVNDK